MFNFVSTEKFKTWSLIASVFVCGAVVMIFELAGSRIMAPYFGGTIYVWTGIIGVIMGSLSLGYWLGGRLADKGANLETYSRVIFFSGAAVFWTLLIKDTVPKFFQDPLIPIEWGSLFSAIVLFAPASVLLGIVSPYAVRLKLVGLEKSASTVGNLYAISTFGSIVGTFAAGYWLIPFMGAANIFLMLFASLAILSLLFSRKRSTLKIIVIVVLASFFLSVSYFKNRINEAQGIVHIDTEYNAIKIFPVAHNVTGRPILVLSFDPFAWQSSMFLKGDDDLVWDYTKYYRLAKHFVPEIKKTLLIGGGAYSYPKDFLKKFPNATMDVVEIDPGMTAAAKKYFRVPNDPRLVSYNEDARTFLNRCKEKYDVIYDDAFGTALATPFQLTTREAVKLQYDMLNDNGAVIANIGASLEGDKGRFLHAEYATFRSVFPQVYIFPVNNMNDLSRMQNIMLVALKSEQTPVFTSKDVELNGYLSHLVKRPIPDDLPILTDDYAPVEYYTKAII